MLELLDESGPAGVVLASRTEARLLEWRFGALTPLLELRTEVIAPPYERSGPVGSRPTGRFGTPTGAQRNARERAQGIRFIERVAAAASRLAHDRGWERLLVSAGEHQTDSLVRALPPALRATASCAIRESSCGSIQRPSRMSSPSGSAQPMTSLRAG